MHFGIDYGSKLAGTTVITYQKDGVLFQISSQKKEDADKLIVAAVDEMGPDVIFIDAPLSLPGAYFGKGEDYFYREADKTLGAMSPMFLGGLTARAMKLKRQITEKGARVFETYPGALVRNTQNLKSVYDKKAKKVSDPLFEEIMELLNGVTLNKQPDNMHQVDSILAWHSGHRHLQGISKVVGNAEEGLIIY